MGVSDLSDVFVSYRRLDVDFTKQLVEKLQGLDKEVWIDWEDIPPGSVGFTDDIKRGIEGADTFIAVLSPDYLESTYCMDMELNYAVQLNKKLIPIVHRKFEGYDIPADISHINWIYFTPHAGQENGFEEAFQKTIDAMETDLEHQRTHKRFVLRAIEWDEHDRGNSFLLNGDEIIQAEQWIADSGGKEPFPSELQKDYIALSRQQATQRQRNLLTGVSFALVLTIFLTIFAGFQWNDARIQRDNAKDQQVIAERNAEISGSLALAFGARELNVNNQVEALGVALEAVAIDNPPGFTQRILGEIGYQPSAVRIFEGHTDNTWTVAISPDGQIAATGAEDNLIILWDMNTGEMLHTLAGHEKSILSLAFSLDGNYLASGGDDKIITLWDVETRELLHTLSGHGRGINALAFSPDNSQLVSGSSDKSVILWDTSTGDLLNTIERPNRVFSVDFHPASNQIAIGERVSDKEGVITVWDTETNTELTQLIGHGGAINDLQYIGDGSQLITASSDSQIFLWDVESATITRRFSGHTRLVRTVAVSPDGNYILTGGDDRTVILWRLADGKILFQYTGLERIRDIAFAPDSEHFITADAQPNPITWTITGGAQIAHFDDPTMQVLGLAISPDGQHIAATSQDWKVYVYDLESDETPLILEGHQQAVSTVAYSPDGSMIASGDAGTVLTIWDAETGDALFNLEGHTTGIATLAFSPDGQYLASGGGVQRTSELFLWDIESQELIREYTGHEGTVRSVAFSPDGSILAAGEEADQIILWDVESGENIHTLTGHTNAVYSVAFSPDGSQLVSGSFDDSLILWNVTSGQAIKQLFGHTTVVRTVAFSPDGQHIISGGDDDLVMIWDINDEPAEPIRAYSGHTDNIKALAYSPNNDYFVSGSNDTSIILWRYDTLEALETWISDNRYIPELTCNSQRQFRLELAPACQ